MKSNSTFQRTPALDTKKVKNTLTEEGEDFGARTLVKNLAKYYTAVIMDMKP
jgi:hypothetical protein